MKTVAEIEAAIELLADDEREELETRVLIKRFGLAALSEEEYAQLIESLGAADREIDAGISHSAEDLREAVRRWTGQ